MSIWKIRGSDTVKNLIPKSLAKQKGIFYKSITWKDIIVFLIILAISCGISFGLIFWSWIIRIIVALCISILLSLLMLPTSHKNDCRLYELWFYKIRYLISPKIYTNNLTQDLCPYDKVKDDTLFSKIPKDGPATYIKVIRIKGLDISSMDDMEAKIKLDTFHNILITQKKKFSIAKINTKYTASANLNFWEKQKDINKELYDYCEISQKTYETCKDQINNQINILSNVSNELKADPYQSNFYFILYDNNIDELNKRIDEIIFDFNQIGLTANELDYYQTINVIKNFYNPLDNNFQNKTIDENKQKISELFNFEKINFKKNHIEINDNLLLSFMAISDYPFQIDNYWLSFVFLSTNANIIMNAKQIEQSTALSLINKAIVNSASNEFIEKKQVQKYQYRHINDGFKKMAQAITRNAEVVFNTNIMLLNYDVDIKSLIKNNHKIIKTLGQKQIKVNQLKYRQFEALNSFLPKLHDDLIKYTGREIPSSTIANGYPFISNVLSDNNGMILGLDWLKKPIMFNPFILDNHRKNHNMMILGSPGSGKSYLVKKIINWNASTNKRVIILDVEREYKQITNAYDGDWINIGTGTSNNCINPLEVIISDDLNASELISNHLLFLETFYQILLPDLDAMKLRYLLTVTKELYYHFKIDKKDVNKWKPTDFPTFSDLYKFVLSNNNKVKKSYEINDVNIVHEIIRTDFIMGGKLGWLYDKHSNINITKNVVCFDLNSLFEKNNYKLTQAQLFLALSYIQKEIKDNTYNDPSITIFIDEAHVLIDENNPIGLDFIYQMVKRIRKRNGGITIISQNPDDFVANENVAKKTQAIINNTQYSFFFNLSPNNVKDVASMYSNYGSGLTEDEKLFIAKAKRGQALFFASGFDRYKIDIFVSNEEAKNFN